MTEQQQQLFDTKTIHGFRLPQKICDALNTHATTKNLNSKTDTLLSYIQTLQDQNIKLQTKIEVQELIPCPRQGLASYYQGKIKPDDCITYQHFAQMNCPQTCSSRIRDREQLEACFRSVKKP